MRYTNPHMNHQMYPMNQQQMQQPMHPQMMQQPMNPQMMNPQMMQQPVMMQQFPQQGMMMQQPMNPQMMQPGMMQQGMMMQQPMPQQAVVNTSRFTQSSNPNTPQQFTQTNDGSRYQQSTPVEPEVEESTVPISFSVKPIVHKFLSNERVKLNTVTSEVKDNNIKALQSHVAVDCVAEVVESIIESAYLEETNTLITAQNFIVGHNFYRTNLTDKLKTLYNGDIKNAYKLLKAAYKESTDKYQINVLDTFDNLMTDHINDFITIGSNDSISIDSFMTDFNDLLKVIRNNEEDLEDKLLDHMDAYLKQFNELTDSVEISENTTVINQPLQVAYIDKHVVETGLENTTTRFIKLEETASNVFLNSLVLGICGKLNTREFLLVTLDRSIFKCMADDDSNVFIRLHE